MDVFIVSGTGWAAAAPAPPPPYVCLLRTVAVQDALADDGVLGHLVGRLIIFLPPTPTSLCCTRLPFWAVPPPPHYGLCFFGSNPPPRFSPLLLLLIVLSTARTLRSQTQTLLALLVVLGPSIRRWQWNRCFCCCPGFSRVHKLHLVTRREFSFEAPGGYYYFYTPCP